MDATRFDSFARLLGRSTARRHLLFGLALSPFAGLVGRMATDVAAKKHHKKKHKKHKPKATPNEYGCLEVGDACQSEEQCCSGICEGKKGARTCVAHDAATCQVDSNLCSTGKEIFCGATNPYCA
jgi:hypothetical protein